MKLKVKVGPKGQIVIPKYVRDSLGIKPNDLVLVDVDDGKATLEGVHVEPLRVLSEIAKVHGVKSSELVWGDRLYEEVTAGS
jgi:AbrB family looped-hinge helix DNA binding protein